MSQQQSRTVIAILADMPLGRLLEEEFRQVDGSYTPWIYALFLALEHQNRYDIHWITLKKYVSRHTIRSLRGQTIHIIPDPSLALGLFTGHVIASRRIRSVLSRLQPGLVHVWGIELPYAKACMKQPCARLLSYQGSLVACCSRSRTSFFPKMQAFWEKRTTPAYRHITCESPWTAERVLEINPDAVINQVDYGVEDEFKDRPRIPSQRPSCLFAGTLFELKGIRYLIEAFNHPDMAGIDLYLAGEGALRRELEPISAANIHWLGRLSRQQIREQLQKAWCLVHPTLADTGPTIVKEARYMGLPVITTTEAGSKQYIEEGQSGYIIPVRDSEAIRKAVHALTKSLDRNMEMGLHGLDEVRQALDIRLTADKLLALYNSLLPGESA